MTSVTKENISIVSIDIGRENFAIYVERIPLKAMLSLREEYHDLPKKVQKKVDGKYQDPVRKILKKIFQCGSCVLLEKVDIRSERVPGCEYDNRSRLNLFSYLCSIKHILDDVDLVLIEQQFFSNFSFGKNMRKTSGSQANVAAIKVGETTLSWFLLNYPEKEIMTYSSIFKTQFLGADRGMTKPQRKKWSVAMNKHIFQLRKDTERLELFERKKFKKDDIADTVIQLQSFKFKELIIG